ncbi:MAG TPA: PAS domain-containing sensor histidine kinase [Drouetiella sp.]
MALGLTKKVLILVAIPVVSQLVLVGILLNLIANVQEARTKSAHARELSSHITSLMAIFVRRAASMAMRRMITEKAMTLQERQLAARASNEISIISTLAATEETEKQNWNELERLGHELDDEFTVKQTTDVESDPILAAKMVATVNRDFNRMFAIAEELSGKQIIVQNQSQEDFEKYDRELKQAIELSLVASVILAICTTAYFNVSTRKHLRTLMKNTTSLAAGKPPVEHVSGKDELAQIDEIYHQMYQDLQILRQKERAILDNASQVICSLDKDLKITDINDASNKVWGISPAQLLGNRFLELLPDEDKAEIRSTLQSAMRNKTEARFEARIIKVDKSLCETAWSATWSEAQNSLYCVVTDISEQKELERMKQEFVSMISHDLRTPLNSVLAAIELVTSGHFSLDDQVQIYMDRAHRNLKYSLSLINQLLEIEKMESGHIKLEIDVTSTKEIITKAVEAVLDLSNSKQITIKMPETNFELIGDTDRLVQVTINLLGNALKFSPNGSEILITEEEKQDCLRVTIADRGRGIPRDQQSGIFERFKQVNPADRVEKQGTGLGLAICKTIVEAHNGRIGVVSEPGAGSSFWFEIPKDES